MKGSVWRRGAESGCIFLEGYVLVEVRGDRKSLCGSFLGGARGEHERFGHVGGLSRLFCSVYGLPFENHRSEVLPTSS